MPQRTIAQAREALDHLTLAPSDRREYEQMLTRHVKKETARLSVRQSEQYQALDDAIGEIKTAYTAIQQQLEDLDRDSRTTDITASEYQSSFEDLQRHRDRLQHRAMSVQSQIDRYTEIEDDPEGYLDSLYERFPTIKPEFPW